MNTIDFSAAALERRRREMRERVRSDDLEELRILFGRRGSARYLVYLSDFGVIPPELSPRAD